MSERPSPEQIAAFRRFTRFYTRQLGLLLEGLLTSAFSLTESRVLYEIAHRDGLTAADIGRELGLDAGYLSRILKRFESRGLVRRSACAEDGRQSELVMTDEGRAAFAPLNRASEEQAGDLLARLPAPRRHLLVAAMVTIERLLGSAAEPSVPYILRPLQTGDIGWITRRQGMLYAEEYGWDETFEALVAEIAAAFVKSFDPKREACWIAEREGEVVGSVFLVRQSDAVAKLRLLYVEPAARGLGIGRRLVEECIRFARMKNYETLTLWTNDCLVSARRIYEEAGFRLVAQENHRSFGKDLVGQNWDLDLRRDIVAAG
jgi:DNA-binding MarR family transcriptional regulator/N-acetylglutamate synthase-like GNAT family acetyltransferase